MKSVAQPRAALASVIIPCFNQLNFTRLCVAALFKHTRSPWELIVIDNGSTDGTKAYFEGIQDIAPIRVDVIANTDNRGFPAACNQGLQAALGDYLILLNNDTAPTDAWLAQLAAVAESNQPAGMVRPLSNYVSPLQNVENVPYTDS